MKKIFSFLRGLLIIIKLDNSMNHSKIYLRTHKFKEISGIIKYYIM